MSLEQQLLHCLDANLRHRDEVIEEYGNIIDFMRTYSGLNSIKNELATALNIYEKRNDIEPSDFDDMRILPAKEALQAYENKHGLKSFLFDIELPKAGFTQLMPKVRGKEWYGGLYFPPGKFRGFHHPVLKLSRLGLAIEQEKGRFEHESLHCDRRFYTGGYRDRFLPDYDADYSDARWRALTELSLLEEILCYVAEGCKPGDIEKSICSRYFNARIDFLAGTFRGLNENQRAEKRKQFENIILPVKYGVGNAVKMACRMREMLPFELLTPLFFSISPTEEEMRAEKFYSPFSDVSLWERRISEQKITMWDIRNRIQKKGYCCKHSIL